VAFADDGRVLGERPGYDCDLPLACVRERELWMFG